MRARLKFIVLLWPVVVASSTWAQAISPKADGDLRYLLARRAGPPEKNYYELSRTARFIGPSFSSEQEVRQYKPSPRSIGIDIITDLTIRYGVYQAWRVRVVATSDSQKAPASAKDAAYVLIYPRNPDWQFAATKYKVTRTNAGGQNVTYTDLQDGREYTMELNADWPRPWLVYEIEILSSNAFVEIWEATKQAKGPPKIPGQPEYKGGPSYRVVVPKSVGTMREGTCRRF